MNHLMRTLSALVAGLLFGVGLVMSGMTNPSVVIAFLDFSGDWDPTLMFVLAAAVLPNLLVFAKFRSAKRPAFDDRFHATTKSHITGKLVVGSILFGVGWGLSGYCPGPAIVASATGGLSVLIFTTAMIAGAAMYRAATSRNPVATRAPLATNSQSFQANLGSELT